MRTVSITEALRDGQVHLAFAGYVGWEARRPVRSRIRQRLTSTLVDGIVVDLDAVTGIDPSGVGMPVARRRDALDVRKTFRVGRAWESVTRTLVPCGLMALLAGATTAHYPAGAISNDRIDD